MASSNGIIDAGLRLLRQVIRTTTTSKRPSRPATFRESRRTVGSYPGDFTGNPSITYAPHNDELADPGEVVWTWVP